MVVRPPYVDEEAIPPIELFLMVRHICREIRGFSCGSNEDPVFLVLRILHDEPECAFFLFRFAPGAQIVRRGDVADRMFLIVSGRLSVTLEVPGGTRRLSTLSDGMVFGELSLLGRETRSADVHADTMVDCHVLDAGDFEQLTAEDPALACILLANLLRVVGRTARRMTSEVALLAG